MNNKKCFSFEPQVHSYTQLMEQIQKEHQSVGSATIYDEANIAYTIPVIQNQVVSNMFKDDSNIIKIQEETMHQTLKETKNEELPLILRDIPRSDDNTFEEYIFSRPVTFAHKCEDWMIGSSTMAILSGIGAIGAIANPDIIPSHEKVALGFVCAVGVCLASMTVSGIVGGVSEYFADRKKRMLQERMEHTRD